MKRGAFLALVGLGLAGCNAGTVTESDQKAVQEEMSTERFEDAMKKAGKGDILEQEKKAAAERREAENTEGG